NGPAERRARGRQDGAKDRGVGISGENELTIKMNVTRGFAWSNDMSQTPSSQVPDPSLGAAQANAPHRPADDKEEVYFEGSPPLRGHIGMVLLYGLIGIILIA